MRTAHRNLWPLAAAPGLVWLIILFVIPAYTVFAVAMGSTDPISLLPVPAWNPADWNVGYLHQTANDLGPNGDLWGVTVRSVVYVATAVIGALLVGYPVAYFLAIHARRTRTLLLILIVIPFWVSYLMRMLAWVNLLNPTGYINRILVNMHIIDAPYGWLDGHASTVILALIYGYVPYLILPLYASLDRLDRSELEAARDLGASPIRTFIHVTLPLSKVAILGACAIIALPMFGDYYTIDLMSGSPNTSVLANQINFFFHGGPQQPVGAAMTVLLGAFLAALMSYYVVVLLRNQRQPMRAS